MKTRFLNSKHCLDQTTKNIWLLIFPESANSFSDLDDVYYTILKDGLNQILADKKFSPFKSFSELCENYHNTVSVSIKQHRDLSQVLDSDENHSIKEIKMVLQPIDPQQYDKVEIEAS